MDVESLQNPLGVGCGWHDAAAAVGGVLLTASLVAGIASLVVRFRRASPPERRQLKWFAAATAAIAAGLLAGSLLDALDVPETVTSYFNVVPLVALPLAVGVATLRHRLYDVDRALAVTALTALAALV